MVAPGPPRPPPRRDEPGRDIFAAELRTAFAAIPQSPTIEATPCEAA
ncbi:hypothetical protein [Embleya sp. NPDC020886]